LERSQLCQAVNPPFSSTDTARICIPSRCIIKEGVARVDSSKLHYRELNHLLRNLRESEIRRIELHNVRGQRYIGTSLRGDVEIIIDGTPGNDLGAFMDGPRIHVYGNVQDGCGNTMNSGEIVVHGSAGDIVGYAMRGGEIFIEGDVGYRAGIHMKEYAGQVPVMVIGGTAGDFLAEYLAGGIIVLLGLDLEEDGIHRASHVGTGMHGGKLYVHGELAGLGKEAAVRDLDDQDRSTLNQLITDFSSLFNHDPKELMNLNFYKVVPNSERPYRSLYAY
jgi:glutamate synthase domain-containing protein 3